MCTVIKSNININFYDRMCICVSIVILWCPSTICTSIHPHVFQVGLRKFRIFKEMYQIKISRQYGGKIVWSRVIRNVRRNYSQFKSNKDINSGETSRKLFESQHVWTWMFIFFYLPVWLKSWIFSWTWTHIVEKFELEYW